MASTGADAVTTVKETVKEALVGSAVEEPVQQLSAQTRATFLKFAKEEEGELVMHEQEFVDAIAPEEEDYVRQAFFLRV
jgi:solute carrier family 25 aspartate/glutamate transporter 12/13